MSANLALEVAQPFALGSAEADLAVHPSRQIVTPIPQVSVSL